MATQFTGPQLQTLKAAILAETDPGFVTARTNGQTGVMAAFFNAAASPVHAVWGTSISTGVVQDAIDYTAYTPNGTIDATAAVTNRLLAAQTKQMNLQLMLQGRDSLNCSRARTRSSLLDSVTNLPTGNAGALQSAGGTDGARVMNALTRPATRGEKLFTLAPVTTGTVSANLLTFEGSVSEGDINAAQEA
jgi:hypothetical protein